MNNEARVYRSTKSVIVGKAKVMSYEDIEEARAKRAAEEIFRDNGKRGQKRKSVVIEAGKPESKPDKGQIIKSSAMEGPGSMDDIRAVCRG